MRSHSAAEARIAGKEFQVCIIGGGATGAGCALDAQLRGLSTVLLEGNDFASGTSSTSTKLIHGGVRYLEQAVKEFDLAEYRVVRRALHERIRMLHNGPYLSRPLEFIVPCFDWFTSAYMGIGLKLYDAIAGEAGLFRSRFLSKDATLKHLPLLKADHLVGSVAYADGQFDDGRYNLALVKSMVEAGGEALNHARVLSCEKDEQGKLRAIEVQNQVTGRRFTVRAKVFVNATGPWADTIRQMVNRSAHARMRLSKGIHIFLSLDVHRGKSALLIPKTEDGRVLFAVPWFDRLLVGTTETEAYLGDEMFVTKEDVAYVLRHLNKYLAVPVTPDQILSGTAGMRPLVSESGALVTSKLARDHEVELDEETGLISIMGGKWTTYRAMAEDTINAVQKSLRQDVTPAKTRDYCLAGSEGYAPDYAKNLTSLYPISEATAQHLAVKFGTRATNLLDLAREDSSLAEAIVPEESPVRAEIVYAIREEMAMTIEDVLSRRTGLQLLSWRAARDAAPAAGALLARELGWSAEQERGAVQAYQAKITRMLELAGLPDRQHTGEVLGSETR
jgi:glycerol-3-phosphate dehydrogenase